MGTILKIYLNPKGNKQGFEIYDDKDAGDYAREKTYECQYTTSLDGCSSMSFHDSKAEAIDQARKELGGLFNKCF